jgi:hypothetical protein
VLSVEWDDAQHIAQQTGESTHLVSVA